MLICSTTSEEHLYSGVTNFKKLMRKLVKNFVSDLSHNEYVFVLANLVTF